MAPARPVVLRSPQRGCHPQHTRIARFVNQKLSAKLWQPAKQLLHHPPLDQGVEVVVAPDRDAAEALALGADRVRAGASASHRRPSARLPLAQTFAFEMPGHDKLSGVRVLRI
jgi:hypothetical protein